MYKLYKAREKLDIFTKILLTGYVNEYTLKLIIRAMDYVQRVSNLITNIIVHTILFNFIYLYTQIINDHHKLNW